MAEKDKNSNGLLSTYGFKSMGYYMAESVICSVYIISIVFASIHFNCPKLLWALIGVLIL